LRSKKRVLAAVLAAFAVVFVVGFVAAWVHARDDKRACEQYAMPPGAVTVGLDTERICIWRDRAGSTVRTQTLP
jgi:hypothetical protein